MQFVRKQRINSSNKCHGWSEAKCKKNIRAYGKKITKRWTAKKKVSESPESHGFDSLTMIIIVGPAYRETEKVRSNENVHSILLKLRIHRAKRNEYCGEKLRLVMVGFGNALGEMIH